MPTTYFAVSLPCLPLTQEPKAAPETPAATGTTGGNATTQQPGGAPASGQAAPCGGNEMLIYMPLFLVLMWFMVLRPEQKRKKEQQNLLSSIKQGDRVVTIGGMHGVVVRLTEKAVVLKVDAAQMTFDRVAIARVERDEPATDAGKS